MFSRSRNHLSTVNETYFQHQRFAFRYGLTCFKAGLMAFAHGLLPALFETKASETVKRLAGVQREDN